MKAIKSNFKIRSRRSNVQNVSSEQRYSNEDQNSTIQNSFTEENNNINLKQNEDISLTPQELSDVFERDSRRYSYSLEVEI